MHRKDLGKKQCALRLRFSRIDLQLCILPPDSGSQWHLTETDDPETRGRRSAGPTTASTQLLDVLLVGRVPVLMLQSQGWNESARIGRLLPVCWRCSIKPPHTFLRRGCGAVAHCGIPPAKDYPLDIPLPRDRSSSRRHRDQPELDAPLVPARSAGSSATQPAGSEIPRTQPQWTTE